MTQPLGNRRPEVGVISLVSFRSDARWLRKQRVMAAAQQQKHAEIAATEAV
jgi:hypothetical protein